MTQMTGEQTIQVGEDLLLIDPVHRAAGAMVRFLLNPGSEASEYARLDAYSKLDSGDVAIATQLAHEVFATYIELQGGK